MSVQDSPLEGGYRGRLAPSPTGLLHMGHAKIARQAGGILVLRNEDLDHGRVKPEFVKAFLEDLKWFGIEWVEGPDVGGPHAPYNQSERMALYREAFAKLRDAGHLYPCSCSRRDILSALSAPHEGEEEPVYPGTCRDKVQLSSLQVKEGDVDVLCKVNDSSLSDRITRDLVEGGQKMTGCSTAADDGGEGAQASAPGTALSNDIMIPESYQSPKRRRHAVEGGGVTALNIKAGIGKQQQQQQRPLCWRFRVPHGETIHFTDKHFGPQTSVAGKDFGDFVVWRNEGVPSYQLSCVVDDAAMQITEVVRGQDLMTSTARQLLLYRALGLPEPTFFHTPLVLDSNGVRLAKRHDALSLRAMREAGSMPEGLREGWVQPSSHL